MKEAWTIEAIKGIFMKGTMAGTNATESIVENRISHIDNDKM